jgi:hypothetical protein
MWGTAWFQTARPAMISRAVFFIGRILLRRINDLITPYDHCAQFYPQKMFTSTGQSLAAFRTLDGRKRRILPPMPISCAEEKFL